jgi:hypothetical protein
MSRYNHPEDRQQTEVYDAETKIWWSKHYGSETYETLEECWVYVNGVMNKAWFKKRFPATYENLAHPKNTKPTKVNGGRVWVSDKSGYKMGGLYLTPTNYGGSAGLREMSLSKYARQQWIMLHELAHMVNANENRMSGYVSGANGNYKYNQSHGWQFCHIYLTLVAHTFGMEAKKELRQNFKDRNVKYNRPAGKTFDEKQYEWKVGQVA